MLQQIQALITQINNSLATIAAGGGLTQAQAQQVVTALTSTAAQAAALAGGTATGPAITSVSPNTSPVGGQVTIAGSGFGTTQGSGSVVFTGTSTPASVTMWTDSAIVVVVPAGATTGPVTVTTNSGAVATSSFTVQ